MPKINKLRITGGPAASSLKIAIDGVDLTAATSVTLQAIAGGVCRVVIRMIAEVDADVTVQNDG